jgi:hemerythrin
MLINSKELSLVAMDFMNEVHKEEVVMINTLFKAILSYEEDPSVENIQSIELSYQAWYSHTLVHFKNEEDKMIKLKFPPYLMHKGEHDKALLRMEEVHAFWQQTKEIQAFKVYLIEELPSWLKHHIATMDTITATFFSSGLSPCALH